MNEEPTVLDYLKAKLAFWRHTDLHFPDEDYSPGDLEVQPGIAAIPSPDGGSEDNASGEPGPGANFQADLVRYDDRAPYPEVEPQEEIPSRPGAFPWRISLALLLALLAQIFLDPPPRQDVKGALIYLAAAAMTAWSAVAGELHFAPPREELDCEQPPVRWEGLVMGLALALASFYLFGSGKFSLVTLVPWILTLGVVVWVFWVPAATPWLRRAAAFLRRRRWRITITPWMVLVFGAALAIIFFRVYRLAGVPPEMVSDHAEKLLDVSDVLNGNTSVFFPRNTGREFFQFYLTAAVISIFNTGLSFLSLKIGTTIMGLLTLPYVYLLGKEIGNKRVALLAALLMGIAYWPNVITRIALRFTLYPAFVAPLLYYLIRGLRRSNRNDFIFAGIALGLGLNGYTSYRIVPLIVLVGFGIYLLHEKDYERRIRALIGLATTAVVSFVIFIPLFRYALDNPDLVLGRSLSRISGSETPLPGPALLVFVQNLWNACTMFFWSDGLTWVHSVIGRPALETVSAALFLIGLVLVIFRYARQRRWSDLYLILCIPLLMLPSILSLAFPIENPSLNRTGGAMIPVFLFAGIGLDALITSLRSRLPHRLGITTAGAVASLLLIVSASNNYDLVFNQYYQQYLQNSWNTSEIGAVIRGFAHSIGTENSAFVIAYPYWVDTRLVGINAGYPTKDYAITVANIADTHFDSHAKLFIVNEQDAKAIDELHRQYPQGAMSVYQSAVPGKDFLIYQVPPG